METAQLKLTAGRSGHPGLSDTESACYDFLDGLGIPYFTVTHPACADMEACRAVDSILEAVICKNLFLCNRQMTDFYLLMMPGDKRFLTKELSHALGVSRLSFADADHMREFLHLSPGSVSVLGLLFDRERRVRLVIDRDVLRAEWVGCHPCVNTASLKLRVADLMERVLPALGHLPTVVTLTGEGS